MKVFGISDWFYDNFNGGYYFIVIKWYVGYYFKVVMSLVFY